MMDGVSTAANVIAVVELAGSIAKVCGKYIIAVKNARSDIERLTKEVDGLSKVLARLSELLHGPYAAKLPTSEIAPMIHDCKQELSNLQEKLNYGLTEKDSAKKAMMKLGLRSLRWPLRAKEVDGFVRSLENWKQLFNLSLQLDQTPLLLGTSHMVNSIQQGITLDSLLVAEGSEFDSYIHQYEDECLPNTRVDLRNQIAAWAQSPKAKSIFWLNGMAGTGKSTVCRTFARSFESEGKLGASFFFKRGEGSCGTAARFFPTITKHLISRIPRMAPLVQEAVQAEPMIVTKSLVEQFNRLILQPLIELRDINPSPTSTPVIIVIDALDECESENDIRTIIRLLPLVKESSGKDIRIFVTSRPELPIRLGFKDISSHHHDVVLHDIPKAIIEHDISVFMQDKLSIIRKEHSLPNSWPGDENLRLLVEMAVPLFIFAATMCRFIADHSWDPEDRLRRVLEYRTLSLRSKLAGTYLPILDQLLVNQDDAERKQIVDEFREVVGAIIVLGKPLSTVALASLLNINQRKVYLRLKSLHSVLYVPDDELSPVRVLHLSFRDFLLDSHVRNETPLWIDEKDKHRTLVLQCLRIMTNPDGGLQKNICELPSPGILTTEISNKRIESCISEGLQYSCCFWTYHLEQSRLEQSELRLGYIREICDFLQKHLLHWLEIMSILGKIPETIGFIDTLQSLIKPETSHSVRSLIHDAKRFVLQNTVVLAIAPLQVYVSALLFTPTSSCLRKTFQQEIPDFIVRRPTVQEDWSAALQTLEGHTQSVKLVVFSPRGNMVASGGSDGTVRLWDTATGTLLHLLEAHIHSIQEAAFSPDGQVIVSCSLDSTTRVWDTSTGAILMTLDGEGTPVYCVTFSPDGQLLVTGYSDGKIRIWQADIGSLRHEFKGHRHSVVAMNFSSNGILASCSRDKTVKLWDAATGALVHTLAGHTGHIRAIDFSPDGNLLASCCWDRSVKIWNVANGALQHTFGHERSVEAVIFSPNGEVIASTSLDETVKIWHVKTGLLLHSMVSHTGPAHGLAFSPTGHLLASSSSDKTVKLWDVTSGTLQQTLEGHTAWVEAVRFSPDGKVLASASWDTTVKIWDTIVPKAAKKVSKEHTESVETLAFSPNGLRIVSGSSDRTVRIWNIAGDVERVLEGHTDSVDVVAFSWDGNMLATGSMDKTIKLWDFNTGALLHTLQGHTDWIKALGFSIDGKLVASGSSDNSCVIWNTASGAIEYKFRDHEDWVQTVAFSLSGDIVASGSLDGSIKLWNLATGELRQTLKTRADIVCALAFSPEGRWLAVGTSDRMIQLWDLANGCIERTLIVDVKVLELVFSDDSRQLRTDKGTLDIWSSPDENGTITSNPTKPGVFVESQWISIKGESVMWLPPEYRPASSAVQVRGNLVAIGSSSGNLILVELKV